MATSTWQPYTVHAGPRYPINQTNESSVAVCGFNSGCLWIFRNFRMDKAAGVSMSRKLFLLRSALAPRTRNGNAGGFVANLKGLYSKGCPALAVVLVFLIRTSISPFIFKPMARSIFLFLSSLCGPILSFTDSSMHSSSNSFIPVS